MNLVLTRDTRHRDHGRLVFPLGEWRAFLAQVRARIDEILARYSVDEVRVTRHDPGWPPR